MGGNSTLEKWGKQRDRETARQRNGANSKTETQLHFTPYRYIRAGG